MQKKCANIEFTLRTWPDSCVTTTDGWPPFICVCVCVPSTFSFQDTGVGKSSIVCRFVQDHFDHNISPTIGWVHCNIMLFILSARNVQIWYKSKEKATLKQYSVQMHCIKWHTDISLFVHLSCFGVNAKRQSYQFFSLLSIDHSPLWSLSLIWTASCAWC